MKIVNQSAVLLEHNKHPYKFISDVAHTCYKAEPYDEERLDLATNFVKRLVNSKHLAMLEHEYVYFFLDFKAMNNFLSNEPKALTYINIGENYISGSLRAWIEFIPWAIGAVDDEIIRLLAEKYPEIIDPQRDIGIMSDRYGIVKMVSREDVIEANPLGIINLIPHTIKFITSRGVSHELVRHRPASFCITGDTILRSMGSKHWTVKQLYEWLHNPKYCGRLKLMKLRSVDENTNVIVPNTIKNIIKIGKKPCFKLTTESKRVLKCTSDHLIYTPNGYKKLQELKINDYVYSNGIELLDNKDWLYDFYINKNHTRKETADFIGCCESLVWKSFKKFNITKPHSSYPNRKPGHGNKGMFTEESKQKLREIHYGDKNPTWIMDRAKITDSAGRCEANRKYQPDFCEFCGATEKLERHHIDKNPRNNTPENIMFLCQKCHHLWHKNGAIGVFKDKIISIEPIGEEDVYDVEMNDPYHNFVADSIVVHNCQESQRYVGYDKDKFGHQIEVITPLIDPDSSAYNDWHYAMLMAETQYMNLRKEGLCPEIARGVLPNDCKTEIVVTATETEWQHIINLRYHGTTGKPHPQMKELMDLVYPILQKESNGRIK